MPDNPTPIAAGVAFFAALYAGLFYLSEALSGNQAVFGLASLIYLPAFVRLLGFMILRFWVIPALFAGSLIVIATSSYDIEPGNYTEITVAAFTAVGGPLGAYLAARLFRLDISLSNLTMQRLLLVSAGCALGNAIAFRLGLELSGVDVSNKPFLATVFFGDVIGTWVIIYLLKIVLTVLGRRL